MQISSEDQFIVNYTLHQDTNDIHTLNPHLKNYEYLYRTLPESLTADAGYGSQENYELMATKGIKGYVKFNTFDKEQIIQKKRKLPPPSIETSIITIKKEIITCARWARTAAAANSGESALKERITAS